MTDQGIKPYLGKAVRVTLADWRVLARVLHAADDQGHSHVIASDAIREGDRPCGRSSTAAIRWATIENASEDPAATP
jgi:hypothetical protein